MSNPLLATWQTPFGAPPFADIRPEHFRPAFDAAMAEQKAAIDAIAADPAEPSFANTIVALETSGLRLDQVGAGLLQPDRRRHQRRARGDRARHRPAARAPRDRDLAERAALPPDRCPPCRARRARARRRAAPRARALPHDLRPRRRQARPRRQEAARRDQRAARDARHPVRPERARRREGVDARPRRRGDLAGLPDWLAADAAQAAADRGLAGKHVITLSRSSIEPFLQFSARRDLREKAFEAWIAARRERRRHRQPRASWARWSRSAPSARRSSATTSYADFRLADTMAKTPAAALDLLDRGLGGRRERGRRSEADDLQALIAEEGGNFRARRLGLALLCREDAEAPLRFRRAPS